MRAGGDHTTAEQERLALYLMGALGDAERESFEEHLAGCWQCLDEAAVIGPPIAGLAGLNDDDWALPGAGPVVPAPSPAADPVLPAPPAVHPPPGPATASPSTADTASIGPADSRPADSRPADSRPADSRPADSRPADSRPAGSRPPGRRATNSRPGAAATAWRRRRVLWTGALALVLALAGGVVAVSEWATSPDPVLTASGEAPGYGASLSVAITVGDQGSATIRITVTGLRQGLRYRLFAVTRDGATHVVRDWTATSGPQEVAGETSLPVAELSFITVGLVDGSAIVTAPIAQGPASPR
ncbi:zf-HC2 domain-containing protein [Verrucosispora sp. WMMD573]|uniref:zf-HC2 domain-containing protein n=1 Tax=Verrucosispora sp. WMMD573 TaxID=3015149 RepID=UPI00248AF730|nr:zf-HC2 domain-containing protein [Verrucosispora sp. WMMD573]WBB55273.1 zf-HC2 domain-containing protein [Verrucosispora sp. WMMD573]